MSKKTDFHPAISHHWRNFLVALRLNGDANGFLSFNNSNTKILVIETQAKNLANLMDYLERAEKEWMGLYLLVGQKPFEVKKDEPFALGLIGKTGHKPRPAFLVFCHDCCQYSIGWLNTEGWHCAACSSSNLVFTSTAEVMANWDQTKREK